MTNPPVIVRVPAAVGGFRAADRQVLRDLEPPTLEELCQAQAAEIRALEGELERVRVVARTVSNIACALVKTLVDANGGGPLEIVIARAVSDRMIGAQITIGGDKDTDKTVRVRERQGPAPLGWEGA